MWKKVLLHWHFPECTASLMGFCFQSAVPVFECWGVVPQSGWDNPGGWRHELHNHHGADAEHYPADIIWILWPAYESQGSQHSGRCVDVHLCMSVCVVHVCVSMSVYKCVSVCVCVSVIRCGYGFILSTFVACIIKLKNSVPWELERFS